MPDTRGKMLPSDILPLLRDPSIQNYLRSFVIATTSSESIGRYPGNGSAQDDQYVYPDAADVNFAYNFDYVVPSNFQRLVSAKLSFKIRAYRTYSTFSLTTTSTDATAESGHHHTHNHAFGTWNSNDGDFTSFQSYTDGAGTLFELASRGTTTQLVTDVNSVGSSGHTHSHSHTVNVNSTLGIAEDVAPNNPSITVKVDGTDVTAQLKPAGPYNSDQVEIDVTQVLKTAVKVWHTLSLQPNQRVRITGILRISYYIDARLAQ